MSWEQSQAGWQLVVIDGPAAGRRLPITGTVTVGRAPEMTLSLPQDGYLSGRHARFEAVSSGLLVVDMGSTNGTYLNGERVADATAYAGDQLRVGSVTLAVEGPVQRPNASQPSVPPQQPEWMQQPPAHIPQPAFTPSPFFNAPEPVSQQPASQPPMWGQPVPEPQHGIAPWAQGFGQAGAPAAPDWSAQPSAKPRPATVFEAPAPYREGLAQAGQEPAAQSPQPFAPWDAPRSAEPQASAPGQERSPWELVAPSLSQGSQPGQPPPVPRAATVQESRPEAWPGQRSEPSRNPAAQNARAPWELPPAQPQPPAQSGFWGEHPPAPSPQSEPSAPASQTWTPSTPSPWETQGADQPSPWSGLSPALPSQPVPARSSPAVDPWHSLREPEPPAKPFAPAEPSFFRPEPVQPEPEATSEPAGFRAQPAPRAGWQDSPWASFLSRPEPSAPANEAEATAAPEPRPFDAEPQPAPQASGSAFDPLPGESSFHEEPRAAAEPTFESFLDSEPSHAQNAASDSPLASEPIRDDQPSSPEPASSTQPAPQPAATPEPAPAPSALPSNQPGPAAAEAALNILSALHTPLFALVDAAADPAIPELLQRAGQQVPMQNLFEGERAISLARWAPYLVDLRPSIPASGAVLAELVLRGWGRGWASYFVSPAHLADVRTQLRPSLTIRGEGGADTYFRFYDPRVLRDYLPLVQPVELSAFFGSIEAWFLEGQNGERLYRLNAGPDGRLVQRSAALAG